MLKKLWLCRNITKFYKIFGEALDVVPCRIHLKNLTQEGFLYSVKYDVAEIIKAQQYVFDSETYPIDRWLDKLYKEVSL